MYAKSYLAIKIFFFNLSISFMLDVNLVPLPTCIIYYETNTFVYKVVNKLYSCIYNLTETELIDKEVGCIENIPSVVYSDINLILFLNNLKRKSKYKKEIVILSKQLGSNKNTIDNLEYIAVGNEISTDTYIVILISSLKLDPVKVLTIEPTYERIINNTYPVYLYWKDYEGKYLGSNNSIAAFLAVNEPVITSLDYEGNYTKYIDNYLFNNKEALYYIKETHLVEGKNYVYYSHKIPVIVQDFVVSVLYIYCDITELSSTYNKLLSENNTLKSQLDTIKVSENTYLSDVINNLFNNRSSNSINEFQLLFNQLSNKVDTLYSKTFVDKDSIVYIISVLSANQQEDLRRFSNMERQVLDMKKEIDTINSTISFFTALKTLNFKLFGAIITILILLGTLVFNHTKDVIPKRIIDIIEFPK